MNEKALKTAVFEGWREMDQYMRDNKIEGQAPAIAKEEPTNKEVGPASKKSSEKVARSDKH